MTVFPTILITITLRRRAAKHRTITNMRVHGLEDADFSTSWLACRISEGSLPLLGIKIQHCGAVLLDPVYGSLSKRQQRNALMPGEFGAW